MTDIRPLRSYGRRKAKPLSARKERLIGELLPRLRLDLKRPAACRLDRAFPGARQRGLARDRLRLWRASALAGRDSIKTSASSAASLSSTAWGACSVRSRIAASGPSASMTATHATCWPGFAEGSIVRIFILFPDPWPKKRQLKRRLLCEDTVSRDRARAPSRRRIQICLRQRRLCRRRRCSSCSKSESFHLDCRDAPTDWRERPADWPETRYERKALARGASRVYLSFSRL